MSPRAINKSGPVPGRFQRSIHLASGGTIFGFLIGVILISPRLIVAFRQIAENRYFEQKLFRLTGFILQDALQRWLVATIIFTLAGLLLSIIPPPRWLNRMVRTVSGRLALRKFVNSTALLFLALLIGVNAIIVLDKKTTSPPGPNIVLITIDTLRADHLGCYGYERNTSPNIDALARRSVLFRTAITPRTKTAPAVASILTGQYPHTHEVRNNRVPLPKKAMTLQEILRDNNYLTAAVLGNYMLKRELSGLSPGFVLYDDRMPNRELNRNLYENTAEQINRSAFNWLEENHKKRFFLWIHYQDPHGPYTAPREYQDTFSHHKNQYIPIGKVQSYQRLPQIKEDDGKVDAASYRDAYDAEILYCDDSVGKLIAKLRELVLEDTVIILAADHGESLGEHDYYFGHGKFVYEACSRVPLIIYTPSATKKAVRIEEQVNLMNIAPTILDLAGIPIPDEMEGMSLIPLIKGETFTCDEFIFLEKTNKIKAVRTNDWKYINNLEQDTDELYHLRYDPLETVNVASQNQLEVDRFKTKLREWMNSNDYIPIGKEHYQKLNKIEREALESLGYL